MVIVRAHVIKGRNRRQKEALIGALTDAVTAAVGVPPDKVRVLLLEFSRDDWGIPGATDRARREEGWDV